MLEICVSCRHKGQTAARRRGDILAAKISPAWWGRLERRVHLITLLEDPDLEGRMRERGLLACGLPYARWGTDPASGRRQLLVRSALRAPMARFDGAEGVDSTVECPAPTPPAGAEFLRRAELLDAAR